MLPRHDLTHRTSAIARTSYDLQRLTSAGVKNAEGILPGLEGCQGDTRGIVGRELFARFYDPSTMPEGTPNSKAGRMAQAIHAELDRTDALADLQRFTQLDPVAASAAFCNIADALADVSIPEPAEDQDAQEGAEGAEGAEGGNAPGAGAAGDVELDSETQAAIRAALAAGIRKAVAEEKEVAEAAISLFGPEGDNLGRRDADASRELRRALAARGALARAIDLLGKFRRAITNARTRHVGSGAGEPFSVRPKRDIRSAIPSELLTFANPDTRTLAFYRFQQGQTMCYERRSREKQQRGPFTILLDGSGSMSGSRWEHGVTCSVAALLMAREQGREVAALIFNAGIHPVPIDFSTRASTLATLNGFIQRSPGGGTRINEAFEAIRPEGEIEHPPGGDVLLISDGIDPGFDAELARSVLDELGADLAYIVIGCETDAMPSLRDLASTYWRGTEMLADDHHLADTIATAI